MTAFLWNLRSTGSALLVSAGVSLLLNHFSSSLSSAYWHYGLLCLMGLSFLFNLVYAARAGSDTFTQLLLAGVVIRLLLSLVVVLIASFKLADAFLAFSIQFIFHYILFTVFEIRYLLQLIKYKTPHS